CNSGTVNSELNSITVEAQRVLYVGKQLEYGRGKRLTDYNIENYSNLFVVLRLIGGYKDEPKELDDSVELTDAPDMITWNDDPDNKRAKMPCGHAIGPESLTAYCKNLLTAGKFIFRCPYISPDSVYCGKEWAYVDIRRLAVLTPSEKKEFETKISSNYLRRAQGIQECPKCKSLCERVDVKARRVVCVLCSATEIKFEFCWYCLHEWKDVSSVVVCGNSSCSGEDPRLKILRECPKKCIVGVTQCPSRRACPSCGMLIEHETACKHMVCPCGQKFCFICLTKPNSSGSYQCGTYNSKCRVAEIQTKVPGMQ
ncbi:putative E3 ubiquitin-protein ligase ariadne-2, partial [Saccoglossus kowalevskii]|uniref:Probable E3 ubiquitin-protein ligase ARI9-like n=1 Tax=Saccoglossus kowalevskii TaxID=10224 RepID=A0ABM0GKX6_SACKO